MKEDHINVLFLGGARRVSLGERFISDGKSIKKNVNLFSYELNSNVPISSIAKIIVGLHWNSPLIIEHLKNIIQNHKINIVIPLMDEATVIASILKNNVLIYVYQFQLNKFAIYF